MTKRKPLSKPKRKIVQRNQAVDRSPKPTSTLLIVLVFAIIIFGSYSLYKSMIKPLGINEVGSPSSISCAQGFSDNFDNSLNSNNWNVEVDNAKYPKDVIRSDNGRLNISAELGNPSRALRLLTKNNYSGDFVLELDMTTPISVPSSASSTSQLLIRATDYTDGVSIVRLQNGNLKTFHINKDSQNVDTKEISTNSQDTYRVKIVRSGSDIKTYYKKGTDNYGSFTNFPGVTSKDVNIRIILNNHAEAGGVNTVATSVQASTFFDNFSLSCVIPDRPPTPNNPRSTCNPDGKSVRLMWDGVDSANSYKVRVDDKAGKVTPFDGISKTEYIANITANQTYSWWAHATKDGIDSAETTRLEFRCTPTSTPTPTPKPTVKPTVAPTVTPTITPTAAPTNSTYVAPTTTQAQKFDLPVEPVSTPLPTKSTNPISRFFSWLASLFE
jgi:hypothetical protein